MASCASRSRASPFRTSSLTGTCRSTTATPPRSSPRLGCRGRMSCWVRTAASPFVAAARRVTASLPRSGLLSWTPSLFCNGVMTSAAPRVSSRSSGLGCAALVALRRTTRRASSLDRRSWTTPCGYRRRNEARRSALACATSSSSSSRCCSSSRRPLLWASSTTGDLLILPRPAGRRGCTRRRCSLRTGGSTPSPTATTSRRPPAASPPFESSLAMMGSGTSACGGPRPRSASTRVLHMLAPSIRCSPI
mmetsp:Transcript_10433/g.42192  ORF Transcript_10433/g.42192 Transcript_10433/m.42192 type:complete len:249 (+) Transcript_10433:1571-2317(+)